MKRNNPAGTPPGGFTLVEIIVVVLIIITLAGVLTPVVVTQVDKARKARALKDCGAIAAALGALYGDLGAFPSMDRTGKFHRIRVLLSGDRLPGAGVIQASADFTQGPRDLLMNHITRNNPDGKSGGYPGKGLLAWRGPYLDASSLDPWGRPYAVNIGATFASGKNNRCCWVLSSGPDGKIETGTTAGSLKTRGDDIGILVHKR